MSFHKYSPTSVLAAGACLLFVAGCGGSEGNTTGASSGTTVVVKHGKAQSGGEAAAKPAEGSAAPAATGGGSTGGVGNLKGRVVFQGTAPTLANLVQKGQDIKDAAVCAKEAIPDEKLVVDSSGGVANVVIFLPRAPAGAAIPPPPDKPAEFDNKGCRFVPHVLLLRVNQPLKILNDDFPLTHNTHTYAQRNDNFNNTIPKTGADFVYKKPENEPCEVKCDIHTAWMKGYHFPLDHPFAAVTGPNGEFEIKNIPAGKHSFRVWHESASGRFLNRNLSVTIKPGETENIEIKYDAGSYAG